MAPPPYLFVKKLGGGITKYGDPLLCCIIMYLNVTVPYETGTGNGVNTAAVIRV